MSENLVWTLNTTAIIKKSHPCLFFLKNLNCNLLISEYIDIAKFLFNKYYSMCSHFWVIVLDRNRINRIIDKAEKLIGRKQTHFKNQTYY